MGPEERESTLNIATKTLFDIVTNNAIFLFLNIHMFLFLISFEISDRILLYIIVGILSINIMPSYVAMRYSLENFKKSDDNIFKRYLKGYKKNLKKSFAIGLLGIALILISLLDGVYFSLMDKEVMIIFFGIVFFVFVIFFVSASTIILRFDFNIRETLKVTFNNYFKLLMGSLITIVILGLSLYLSRYNTLPIIVGFSIAGYVQNKFNKNIVENIINEEI